MAKFSLDRKRPPKLAASKRRSSTRCPRTTSQRRPDPTPTIRRWLPKSSSAFAPRVASAGSHKKNSSGLSQTEFAQAFHINVARLRDLEQGRTQADSALLAYLTVIDEAPDTVRRALRSAG